MATATTKKAVKKAAPDYKKVLDRLNDQSKRGGGGDKNYITLEQGKNVLRILPGHPNMDAFFEEVYYHRKQVSRKDSLTVICLNHGDADGDDCPICTELQELRSSKDKADKKLYNEQRPKSRFFMNAINRADGEVGILACGITIMKEILSFVTDADEYGDILDLEEGTDIIITKTGEMLDTEYSVKARRNSSPAFADDETRDEVIGTSAKDTKLHDLTELKTQFEGEPEKVELVWAEGWDALKDADDEAPTKKGKKKPSRDEDEDDEDDEEESPKKPVKKPAKKAKPEPEDDEEEDEEPPRKPAKNPVKKSSKPVEDDDDEEEDEDTPPPPKKAVKKSKPVEEDDEEEEEPAPKKKVKALPEEDDEDDDLANLDSILKNHKKKGSK